MFTELYDNILIYHPNLFYALAVGTITGAVYALARSFQICRVICISVFEKGQHQQKMQSKVLYRLVHTNIQRIKKIIRMIKKEVFI